jgi:hypothetical protein
MKKKTLLLVLFLILISTNALSQNSVYGTISGDIQENVLIAIYTTNCGGVTLEDLTTTYPNGYYSFEGLSDGRYLVIIAEPAYSFAPGGYWVDIPQTEIQSYDFTTSSLIFGTWGAIRFSTVQMYMTFNSDGSWLLTNELGGEASGTFSLSINEILGGDHVLIVSDDWLDSSYHRYSIDGDTLYIDAGGNAVLNGDWTKQ